MKDGIFDPSVYMNRTVHMSLVCLTFITYEHKFLLRLPLVLAESFSIQAVCLKWEFIPARSIYTTWISFRLWSKYLTDICSSKMKIAGHQQPVNDKLCMCHSFYSTFILIISQNLQISSPRYYSYFIDKENVTSVINQLLQTLSS